MSMRTTDPQRFGRVAVAFGGTSAEREVSLDSGRNVLEALRARGVDAHPVDGIPALLDALRAGHYARVFNILHGRGGEDGMLQGALDALRVPYTGRGILGSALAMDKVRTKQVWQALGLPTPRYAAWRPSENIEAAIAMIGYPAIVKPSPTAPAMPAPFVAAIRPAVAAAVALSPAAVAAVKVVGSAPLLIAT